MFISIDEIVIIQPKILDYSTKATSGNSNIELEFDLTTTFSVSEVSFSFEFPLFWISFVA